ncbi:MAG: alpha/beta hydrolase [Sphingorhabdus sp.]
MKRLTISVLMIAFFSTPAAFATPRTCAMSTQGASDAGFHGGKHFSVEIKGPEGKDVPDIILVPGLASPREVWNATVDAQSGCYRLHLVQLYGFGDAAGANADGPLLEPFVRELADYISDQIIAAGRQRPAIVGHSLGGLSAIMIAARYPDHLSKLMVIDAVPYIGTIFFAGASVEAVRPRAETLATSIRAQFGQPKPVDTGRDPGPQSQAGRMSNHPAGRMLVARWTRDSDPRVVAQALLDDMTTDMRPELGKITVPVTLLYAQDDSLGSIDQSTAAFVPQYAGTRDFTAVQVTGSHHFIMLDQPQKFTSELARFLQSRDD